MVKKKRLREERSSAKTGDSGVGLMRQVGEIGIGVFMGMEHYQQNKKFQPFRIGVRVYTEKGGDKRVLSRLMILRFQTGGMG